MASNRDITVILNKVDRTLRHFVETIGVEFGASGFLSLIEIFLR